MFEKSESYNTLLFTVVQTIFLLIDSSLKSGVPKRVAECWVLRPMGESILWWSTPCPATNLTMLLELFKHLTINPEQRQANSNLKGSKPHKGATKPEWVRVGSSQTRFNPLRQVMGPMQEIACRPKCQIIGGLRLQHYLVYTERPYSQKINTYRPNISRI